MAEESRPSEQVSLLMVHVSLYVKRDAGRSLELKVWETGDFRSRRPAPFVMMPWQS